MTADDQADETIAFDCGRLGEWMDVQGLPGRGQLPKVGRIGGGSQNELYSVERGGLVVALRTPPPSAGEARNKAFAREIRVLSALGGTDVPHPSLVAGETDPGVLGVPFFLMEKIDGWSIMQTRAWPAPFLDDLPARHGLAFAMVEGAARLGSVDWRAAGLADFGRPENFHERQVDRWLRFLEPIRTREIPHLDEVAAWLRTHRPATFEPGIMHGDYSFANVMFRHGRPARLAAIVDWEMATIGDPLLDLAWALMCWPPEGMDVLARPPADLEGMVDRQQLLDHYEKISGRSTEGFDYYVVLARFKLGIVLEQSVYRHAQGLADDRVATFAQNVLNLMFKAAQLAETLHLREAEANGMGFRDTR